MHNNQVCSWEVQRSVVATSSSAFAFQVQEAGRKVVFGVQTFPSFLLCGLQTK